MGATQVDASGDIWFFSPKSSNKNRQIQADPTVYLMFIKEGKQHYISLTTEVAIIDNQQKVDKLWNDFMKAWFPGGNKTPKFHCSEQVY